MGEVSRFDNTAQYNPQNTYVGLPFEEIAGVLSSKQQKHDSELNDIYSKSNSLNLPTIREHEAPRENFVNEYNKQFMDLLDSGVEPGSSEFVRKKKQILDQLARDPRPGVFKRSLEAQKQQSEYGEKLRKEGKYGYYNDPYHKGFQGTDELGNPLEYKFKPFNPTEDRIKPVYDFYDKAKPSGYEKEGFHIDPSNGAIIGIKQGYEGIAENFINRNANNYLEPFLSSNAGRDFIAEHTHIGYGPEQIQHLALEHIKDLGRVYIHGKTKQGSDYHYGPEYAANGITEDQFNAQAPITYNPVTTNPYGGEKIDLSKDSNKRYFLEDGTELNPLEAKTVKNSTNIAKPKIIEKDRSPEDLKNHNSRADELMLKWKQIYNKSWSKGIDKDRIIDLYNQAVDNSGMYVPKDKNFSEGKSKMLTNQVLGGNNTIQGLQGKTFQLLGTEGAKQINFKELEELIGEDGGVKHTTVQGRLLDHPDLPGGYAVSISTENGKHYKLAVNADEQTEGWFSNNVSPATKANLSGKDVEWRAGRNKYKTITVPKEDGSGFNTQVITISPSGTFKTDYNEWVKAQHNIYDHAFKHLYSAGYNTTTENKKIDTEED